MGDIYQAPIGKRLLSASLDFLLMLMLFLSCFLPLYTGAINSFGQKKMLNKENDDKMQTDLFVQASDGTLSYLEFNDDYETSTSSFLSSLVHYYLVYKVTISPDSEDENIDTYTNSWFNENILGIVPSSLEGDVFSVVSIFSDPTLAVLKNTITVDGTEYSSGDSSYWPKVESYFTNDNSDGIYDQAVTDYVNSAHMEKWQEQKYQAVIYMTAVSLAGPILVVYLLLPMLLKKGRSLGKRFNNIEIISRDGYEASLFQLFSRSLAQSVIFFASSLLFFLPLLIDLLILFLTKNHLSLADYISYTICIDSSKSNMKKAEDQSKKAKLDVAAEQFNNIISSE